MVIPAGFFCSLLFLPKGCPYGTKSISHATRFYLFMTFKLYLGRRTTRKDSFGSGAKLPIVTNKHIAVLASNFDRSSAFQAGFVYSCFSPQVIDLRLRKNIALQAKAVSQLRSKKNSFCKVVNCKSNGNGATNCKSLAGADIHLCHYQQ